MAEPASAQTSVTNNDDLNAQAAQVANQAPLNSVPGSQETVLDTPLAFTEYRGNLISISDPDAGNLEVEMQLQATNGLVTLVNRNLVASGLTYLVGDGLDDAVIKVRGKIDDINTALSWTAFIPTPGYTGADGQITITTNDLGNVGDGGPQQDVDTIAINVKTPADLFDPSPTWKTFPGLLDESFDEDGVRILNVGNTTGSRHDYDRIWNMELLPDGKILAAANVDGYLAMLRFNSDLNLDTTFGSGGLVKTTTNSYGTNYRAFLTQDAQGRILLAGRGYLYRYLPSGNIDTLFGIDGRAILDIYDALYVNDIGFQGDGDILVAASERSDNSGSGTYSGGIWRMGEDGQNPTRIIEGDRTGMIVWDDGRIIVTDQDFDVQRYTRDAALEQSYDFNHGTTSSILKLPDNRFLIVGYDTGDGNDISVTRHLASGTLDTTFGQSGRTLLPVLEGNDVGYRATLQHDGRILIAGYAQVGSEDGYDIAVARLSYDGVPDTGFFTGYNDATATFSVGDNVDDYGYAILHLPNGKILVAGRTAQGIALARLLGDTNQDNAPANQAPLNSVPGSQETVLDTPLAFTEYRGNLISISDPDAGNLEVEMQLQATNGLVTLVTDSNFDFNPIREDPITRGVANQGKIGTNEEGKKAKSPHGGSWPSCRCG